MEEGQIQKHNTNQVGAQPDKNIFKKAITANFEDS